MNLQRNIVMLLLPCSPVCRPLPSAVPRRFAESAIGWCSGKQLVDPFLELLHDRPRSRSGSMRCCPQRLRESALGEALSYTIN